MRLTVLLAFLLVSVRGFSALDEPVTRLFCDGDDQGYYWTYDIVIEDGVAEFTYAFSDWKGEYTARVVNDRFPVPSPYEYYEDAYLELTDYGWDLKLYNKDGTPSYNYPDEFLCTNR
jgi:hypothetical protein